MYDSYIMKVQVSADELQGSRDTSKLLFGNADRLLVFAAAGTAEPGLLYGDALAEICGIDQSRVGKQLTLLERAGLLVRLPKVGGERRVYFERRESCFWKLVTDFLDEL